MRQAWFISLLVFATAFGCADAKESESTVDAASDPVTADAAMTTRKAQAGEACEQTSDCASLPLYCVDGVCCKSQCDGACEQCDLSGAGDCEATPANSDPDNDCGEVDCTGYFDGWNGNSCFTRANISAIAATCDGARACKTPEVECASDNGGPGPAAITCVTGCQTPQTADTCSGTTIGVCDGPGDAQEPNDTCGTVATLPTLVGLVAAPELIPAQITPAGDTDILEIVARENDADCNSCNSSQTETYFVNIFPSVPVGAGSITFCTGLTCGAESDCQTVAEGSGGFFSVQLSSPCSEQREHRVYLRATRQDGGSACGQYTVGYEFAHFCPTVR